MIFRNQKTDAAIEAQFGKSDYWSKSGKKDCSKILIQQYIEVPSGMLERHEPVVKGKGVPIWSIVAYAQKRNLTPKQVSQIWANYISPVEVRAALEYYKRYPEQIESNLEVAEEE